VGTVYDERALKVAENQSNDVAFTLVLLPDHRAARLRRRSYDER
jgi:hypothetical protein